MMAPPPDSVVYAPRRSWCAGWQGLPRRFAPRRPGGAGRLALGMPHQPSADLPVRRHGCSPADGPGAQGYPQFVYTASCRDVVIWNGGNSGEAMSLAGDDLKRERLSRRRPCGMLTL